MQNSPQPRRLGCTEDVGRRCRAPARWVLAMALALVAMAASADDALFIAPDGRIAISGNAPVAPLDIGQSTRTGTHHPGSVPGLYVTGLFGAAKGIEFRHSNGNQGIGFGYNTIYATGGNPVQHLFLKPRGDGGRVEVQGPLKVDENLTVTRDLQVAGNLRVQHELRVEGDLHVGGTLSAPGLITGTIYEIRNANSQRYLGCTPTGTGRCNNNHAACAAGHRLELASAQYCDVYRVVSRGYCRQYLCYSQ